MAYIAATAIIQRLRELVQDGAGDARQVVASRLTGSILEGMGADEARRRGLYEEKPAHIRLGGLKPHPQRLTDIGSVQFHVLPVTVRIVRTIAVGDQLTESDLDAIEAAALIDQDAIGQALSLPSNLAQTSAAVATGIMGATQREHTVRLTGTFGETMDLTTECRFDLTVKTSPGGATTGAVGGAGYSDGFSSGFEGRT